MVGRIVDVSSPCKPWTGYINRYGYGVHARGGAGGKYGRNIHAHRWVWIQLHGPIPKGMHVHHKCHNRVCVEISHLELKDPSTHKADHIAEDGLTGMAAVHAAAQVCSKGHPFDHHDGRQRICLTCKRERGREWMRRKRAA